MANGQPDVLVRHIRGLVHAEAEERATDGHLLARFIGTKEEAAFGTLVWRHGPMVLGVARHLLQHTQDAEDVFQAAFLLLARNAAAIRKRDSVASWLHGVTLRLAARARAQRKQRSEREKQAATMRRQGSNPGKARDELLAAVNEALEQLPEKYRTALILCHLEGKSHQEAARQLGCPLATLRSWVMRGRKLLRTRLARRGLVLSADAVALVLLASSADAAVPRLLLQMTTKAALAFALEGSSTGIVSLSTAALVEHGARSLAASKVKLPFSAND